MLHPLDIAVVVPSQLAMLNASRDRILPSTITGSYPRPHWFTEQLRGRDFKSAIGDAPGGAEPPRRPKTGTRAVREIRLVVRAIAIPCLMTALLMVAGVASAAPLAPQDEPLLTVSAIIGGQDYSDSFTAITGPEGVAAVSINLMTQAFEFRGQALRNTDIVIPGHGGHSDGLPSIAYGFNLHNLTQTPLTFRIILGTPYTGGPYHLGNSNYGPAVIDDASPFDGPDHLVTVLPTPNPDIHTPSYDGIVFGALGGECSLVLPPLGNVLQSPALCRYGDLFDVPIAASTSGTLQVDIGASVSESDRLVFTGFAEMRNPQPFPEPALIPVLGAALISLAALCPRSGLNRSRDS
jgi:hypothetical protein